MMSAPSHRSAEELAAAALDLTHQGELNKALPLWNELVANEPNRADFRVFLGHVLAALHQDIEAEASYRAAVKVNPKWLDARITLANFLGTRNRVDEALATFRDSLSIGGDHKSRICLAIANLYQPSE